MTNTHKPQHSLMITINKEQILDIIYSESAWYCLLHPQAKCITPDWQRLTMMRVKEGFEEFRAQFQGYIYFSNFNPNVDAGNVSVEFRFFYPVPAGVAETVTSDVTNLLAWYALERFYGIEAAYFHTAFLKHRASLNLTFARDANHSLLH